MSAQRLPERQRQQCHIGPSHPDYANVLHNLGELLSLAGRDDEAKARHREALASYEKLAAADPENPAWQRSIIRSSDRLIRAGDQPAANVGKAVAAVKRLQERGKLEVWEKDWPVELERVLRQIAVDRMYEAGQFAEALAMSERWVESVKRSDELKGPSRRATVRALGITASVALLARQPEKALAACEQALAIAPDDLWPAVNQAHALMFLGRADAARAIYLGHRGGIVSHFGPWEAVVSVDFAKLRTRNPC